ncbi:hypothetical protein H8959_016323, partial [Pygathrix nigripes]
LGDAMFQGQRGWFCRSVSRDLRQFWGRKPSGSSGLGVAEGGTISDPRAADFLFSCDASHPDTLRIYQSLDYIEDNATVFHAYYLSAVANAEIKTSVALGHFILPPACLQKEIRRKIGSFIWEQDQHFLTEKHDEVTPNEIKTLGGNGELATEHKKELSESPEKHFIRTPVVEKQMYFPLQNYPVNNMVTGSYISIDAMKKFLGELHDFIPGSSGFFKNSDVVAYSRNFNRSPCFHSSCATSTATTTKEPLSLDSSRLKFPLSDSLFLTLLSAFFRGKHTYRVQRMSLALGKPHSRSWHLPCQDAVVAACPWFGRLPPATDPEASPSGHLVLLDWGLTLVLSILVPCC